MHAWTGVLEQGQHGLARVVEEGVAGGEAESAEVVARVCCGEMGAWSAAGAGAAGKGEGPGIDHLRSVGQGDLEGLALGEDGVGARAGWEGRHARGMGGLQGQYFFFFHRRMGGFGVTDAWKVRKVNSDR